MEKDSFPIVEITWIDACTESAYLNKKGLENLKPATRKNVGYKIDMTDTSVTITSGLVEGLYPGEEGYDGGFCIPRVMIIKEKELK